MASFSEGVDLPGVYCNNVIIAKLPFSVPTDPVGQTLTEWLEKTGVMLSGKSRYRRPASN